MRAAIFEGIDQSIQVKEWPKPQAGAGEVIVEIKAGALNHRDVWIQAGKYAGIRFPCVLGSDGAGIVVECGDGVDSSWLNQDVVINPGLNWGDNEKFQSSDFVVLGMPQDGTFAEYIKISAEYIFKKPAHLSYEEAAAIPLGGVTGYRAAFSRGGLKSGEKVLVTGVGGGVSMLVVLMALASGAEVWVTSGADDKINKAKEWGVKGGQNYKIDNWQKALLADSGMFDLIVDSACGPDFNKLIDLCKPGGRISFFGGTNGPINNVLPAKVFWRQISIMGSTMGSKKDFQDMLDLFSKAQIKPLIDKVFALEEVEQAFRYLETGTQFGKIILKV